MSELRDGLRGEMSELREGLKGEMSELREDIRIGVEESQNLARLLHAEALRSMNDLRDQTTQAVSGLRRDVVSKLDQILAIRRDTDERPT